MYNKKWYVNGVEMTTLVDETEDRIEREMNTQFELNPDVARYEQMKMADGRLAFSLKDRANKIILQYKEQKNGDTGTPN